MCLQERHVKMWETWQVVKMRSSSKDEELQDENML